MTFLDNSGSNVPNVPSLLVIKSNFLVVVSCYFDFDEHDDFF